MFNQYLNYIFDYIPYHFNTTLTTKNIAVLPHHFPLEAQYLVDGKLMVPPKENDVGTGAIFDFCHVIIFTKVLNHFRKVFRKVTTLSALKTFF